MLTKTQIKILKLFCGHITESFSLTDISNQLRMQYRVVSRSIQPLVKNKYVNANNKRYSLNYKAHHQEFVYVEFLRCAEHFSKKKQNPLRLFTLDVIDKIELDQFILLVFGSAVTHKKPRDYDVLLIVESRDQVELLDKQMTVLARMFTAPFDIHVITHDSVYEMLNRRDQLNILNQVLNKHVLVHGAEAFYRMLSKGRL